MAISPKIPNFSRKFGIFWLIIRLFGARMGQRLLRWHSIVVLEFEQRIEIHFEQNLSTFVAFFPTSKIKCFLFTVLSSGLNGSGWVQLLNFSLILIIGDFTFVDMANWMIRRTDKIEATWPLHTVSRHEVRSSDTDELINVSFCIL